MSMSDPNARAPRLHSLPFLLSLCVAAVLSLLLLTTGCKKEEKALSRQIPEVSVVKIEPRDTPVSFEFVAQTQSSHQVEIRARVNGFLNRRVYTEGAIVKAGQVLFELDPKPFQAQLDQAKAALSKQEAAQKVADANLARVKPLTSLNALSQRDLDDATGNAHSTAAAVDQSKAQVDTARLNLSYCTISSPIDGITGAALQQDGAYISTGNNQLTTVMALSPIWVNFSLSENEMQNYRNQMAKGLLKPPANNSYEVEIILVDGTVFPHTGRITFADPMYSSQTGTFLIRSSVQNPKGILRPNQYVRVRVKGNVRPAAILIPQQAVQSGAKGHFVWIVNPEGTVRPRPVDVGEWYGSSWFINDGLKAGETIVVEGGLSLQPDTKVRTKPFIAGPLSNPVDVIPVADTSRGNAPTAKK
jgi:membrane fusion protein, multidrug efflux system